MRIVALLSWYEERLSDLHAAVASVAAFCDHLIAVDGAYALYPDARGRSPYPQAVEIARMAEAARIGCTVHEPLTPWQGNETEKRSALFSLAEAVTTPDDWYFVIDADEIVTEYPDDLKERLAATGLDVAQTHFWERNEDPPEGYDWPAYSDQPIRNVFRAIRGLRVVGKHYCYVTPDGRDLWGDDPQEQALDLPVRVEHRSKYREHGRRLAQRDYCNRRDQGNVEGLTERPRLV